MEIRAGINLGRYQLLAEIGRGAMGTVFQAHDPDIDRLVAVKIFSVFDSASSDNQEFRDRFAQEAKAAGRLAHPHIVAIYDRGEEPESHTPYIVMEYVAGQPLSSFLTANSMRLEERFALQIAKQIAEALAYAHDRGVVHRDVKPSNILITEEGDAKIADFGVARLDTGNAALNREMMGTPAYMSPEQLTGLDVDGRSDIFSLGVILYTMLSGFRPFQGNGTRTIVQKVVNQQPIPITNFHLDLSKDTEYVVARAMAKNRERRYPTGTAMALDLGDILDGKQPRSRNEEDTVNPEVFRVAPDYRAVAPAVASPKNRLGAASAAAVVLAPDTSKAPSPGPVLVTAPPIAKPKTQFSAAQWIALAGVSLVIVSSLWLMAAQKNRLHAADAALEMPAVLAERLPLPPLALAKHKPAAAEPVSTANVARADSREPLSDLDRTVIHRTPASPAASVAAVAKPVTKPIVPPAGSPATLELSLQHHFAQADVSVWVDNVLAYAGTVHGEAKKHLFVIRGAMQGKESHQVQFPSGDHEIRVHIASKADQYDQSSSIHTTFRDKQRSVLEIRCNKHGLEMSLLNPS